MPVQLSLALARVQLHLMAMRTTTAAGTIRMQQIVARHRDQCRIHTMR